MDLRRRSRKPFFGFTNSESEKMEKLFKNDADKIFDQEYCKKLARVFNRSKGRAGKPMLKLTEIENWFQNRQNHNLSQDSSADNTRKLSVAPETCFSNKENESSQKDNLSQDSSADNTRKLSVAPETCFSNKENENSQKDNLSQDSSADNTRKLSAAPETCFSNKENENSHKDNLSQDSSADNTRKLSVAPGTCFLNKANENSQVPKGQNVQHTSEMEFEAKSSVDGAWYDIEKFIQHRFLSSGEAEVLVRFIGFGPEEDEWVNVNKAVRERSVSLENSECNLVKVGEYVLCFQERKDQARYFEAHVVDIKKRVHDIRGCRCLFTIQYNHDNTQERVHLDRLCFRPCILGLMAGNQSQES